MINIYCLPDYAHAMTWLKKNAESPESERFLVLPVMMIAWEQSIALWI